MRNMIPSISSEGFGLSTGTQGRGGRGGGQTWGRGGQHGGRGGQQQQQQQAHAAGQERTYPSMPAAAPCIDPRYACSFLVSTMRSSTGDSVIRELCSGNTAGKGGNPPTEASSITMMSRSINSNGDHGWLFTTLSAQQFMEIVSTVHMFVSSSFFDHSILPEMLGTGPYPILDGELNGIVLTSRDIFNGVSQKLNYANQHIIGSNHAVLTISTAKEADKADKIRYGIRPPVDIGGGMKLGMEGDNIVWSMDAMLSFNVLTAYLALNIECPVLGLFYKRGKDDSAKIDGKKPMVLRPPSSSVSEDRMKFTCFPPIMVMDTKEGRLFTGNWSAGNVGQMHTYLSSTAEPPLISISSFHRNDPVESGGRQCTRMVKEVPLWVRSTEGAPPPAPAAPAPASTDATPQRETVHAVPQQVHVGGLQYAMPGPYVVSGGHPLVSALPPYVNTTAELLLSTPQVSEIRRLR